jgi:hypothetical protein
MVADARRVEIREIQFATERPEVLARCSACGREWSEGFDRIERDAAGVVVPEEEALLADLLDGEHVCGAPE